jgi:hypothetical protein
MRRLVIAAAALALLGFAPAAGASERSDPAPGASSASAAEVVLTGCEKATVDEDGAADFEARMERVSGAARMQIRFRLQVQRKRRWVRVPAEGFDEWVTSDAGVARYVYDKRVEGLLAPGAYRVMVRFRWLDDDGHSVDRARDYSGVCRQPDPRPNLLVVAVRAARNGYVAQVRNNGRGPAGPFTIALTSGGRPMGSAAVPALPAHQVRFVPIRGPMCAAGSELVAEIDPDQAVDEHAEDDNVLTLPCPV